MVCREDPERCSRCGAATLTQDEDVLDTWFSSGLWPFSTLGWPDETRDLKVFYPTSLLNTGFDILFFWVARMIMFGLEFMGDVPFRQVYIHALVRDAEKQKMSKTRGNAVEPLEIADKYGTDALRFFLVAGASPGTDVIFSEERLAGYQAFANKIWNAARFVLLNLERAGAEPWAPPYGQEFRPLAGDDGMVPWEDRWIFSRLSSVADQANRAIEQFRYHEVAHLLYHFLWHEFCDWYLELKKLRFRDGSGLTPEWKNLLAAFERTLRLLHPLMPFLTEELWQRLAEKMDGRPKSLALASYPQYDVNLLDLEAERWFGLHESIITSARDLRAQMKLDQKTMVQGTIYGRLPLALSHDAIRKLAKVELAEGDGAAPAGGGVRAHTADFDLVLRAGAAEAGTRRDKLHKELAQLRKARDNSRRQLENQEFLAKAPPAVVDSIRQKLSQYEVQITKLSETLQQM
jgi:valyl-tRNA synthetase